tara:strand:- start:57 stop:272 length:216 start_codon:yes stop_codon:yes gene_type:complete
MKKDFHARVRAAAKKASNNGKCWWIESYILNAYLWRGPDKIEQYTKNREQANEVKRKKGNVQAAVELCELS